MSVFSQIKQPFKALRWGYRRAQAARRWGAPQVAAAPVVIGNAMPKSGSHLLIQVLLGLTKIGPFVDPGLPPLTRSAGNRNLSQDNVLARLRSLQPGDIAYAYLHARPPYLSELARPGVATLFIYRDPRDVIVSQIFYAMQMHAGHGMHTYYVQSLGSMEERIDAAVNGVATQEVNLSPIATKYEKYLDWFDQKEILSLRFEDLILDRDRTLARILDHLATRGYVSQPPRSAAISALSAAIEPHSSGTFRKGQPGEWKEHFTEKNKRNFKAATGDLLQRLGYEKGASW